MDDLDQKILEMKRGGLSLRKIAQVVGLTHEGVRKKLMALLRENRVSTNLESQFAPTTIEKKKVSTGSNAHESKDSEESEITVNLRTPSLTPTSGVNPSKTLSLKAIESKKEGNSPWSDDLIGEIVQFLENKGVEVYRMQNGGWQVKGTREIVRFYITRRDG